MMINILNEWLYCPVKVVWKDHTGLGANWTLIEDAELELALITSVGFLLQYDEEKVVIGSCLNHELDTSGDITVLLRSAITHIQRLK